MRARLIGNDIGRKASLDKLRMNFGSIANKPNAYSLATRFCIRKNFQRFIKMVCDLVTISSIESLLYACFVHLDTEEYSACHLCGKRLRSPHAAESGSQHDLPCK